MTRPSRLMPAFVPTPQSITWQWRVVGFCLLAILVASFAWALWTRPLVVLGAIAALTLLAVAIDYRDRRHLRAMAEGRPGESICTFARAVPIRQLDSWVVRAVFEQLQPYVASGQPGYPIRPSDRLIEDLHIDPDDLDDVLAPEIAQRTGRRLGDTKRNPYYGKVATVEDLIRFFCAQPKGGAAEQGVEADEA